MANTSNANNQTRAVLFKRVQGQPPTLTRQSPTVRVSLPKIFWVSGKDYFTYLTKGIISTPQAAARVSASSPQGDAAFVCYVFEHAKSCATANLT